MIKKIFIFLGLSGPIKSIPISPDENRKRILDDIASIRVALSSSNVDQRVVKIIQDSGWI